MIIRYTNSLSFNHSEAVPGGWTSDSQIHDEYKG